jgi:D-glycero-D-manno-heptose 1,7-bisphosphate phosphatase
MIIDNHSVYVRPGFWPQKNWTVFLDRDGVINQDALVSSIKDFKIFSEIIPAIKKLNVRQIPVIVVHNAAAIYRGKSSEKEVEKINQYMVEQFISRGAYLDAVFYCPHHPNAYAKEYAQDCDWHKPNSGMLLAAAKQFKLDLTKSYLIGDNENDILAGEKAEVASFLIKNSQETIIVINKILL